MPFQLATGVLAKLYVCMADKAGNRPEILSTLLPGSSYSSFYTINLDTLSVPDMLCLQFYTASSDQFDQSRMLYIMQTGRRQLSLSVCKTIL